MKNSISSIRATSEIREMFLSETFFASITLQIPIDFYGGFYAAYSCF